MSRSPLPALILALNGLGGTRCSPAEEPAALAFEDVTAKAGIAYDGNTWGIAWGDGNGDGWPDLWSSNHGNEAHYYVNRRDGTFARDTKIPRLPGDTHGVAWADFDADGDQDLLELTGAQRGHGQGASRLFVNTGAVFSEEARAFGLEMPLLRGRAPVWLDWNLDGALDVILLGAKRDEAGSAVHLRRGERFVLDPTVVLGREQAMFAQLTSLGGPDERHLIVHGFAYPQSVHALARSGAVDVTGALGLPKVDAAEDVAFGDFDGDLRTDFFVARGTTGTELARIADDHWIVKLVSPGGVRGLSFRCAGALAISVEPVSSEWWSAEHVHLGADGRPPAALPFTLEAEEASGAWSDELGAGAEKGVFVLAEPGSATWSVRLRGAKHEQVTLVLRAQGAALGEPSWIGFVPPKNPVPDQLWLRRGDGFEEAWSDSGLAPTNSLAAAAADLDNDMDLDLFVLCSGSISNLPDELYENLGQGRFRRVPGAGGAAGGAAGVSDAVAVADYDHDGFLDLLVANGRDIGPGTQGPLQLFRNRGNANHWLRVELAGTRSSAEAIGARVLVEAGGVGQVRHLGTQVHRGAQDERTLHFGLGRHERARVEVRWPQGGITTLDDVACDRTLRVVEDAP